MLSFSTPNNLTWIILLFKHSSYWFHFSSGPVNDAMTGPAGSSKNQWRSADRMCFHDQDLSWRRGSIQCSKLRKHQKHLQTMMHRISFTFYFINVYSFLMLPLSKLQKIIMTHIWEIVKRFYCKAYFMTWKKLLKNETMYF